MKNPIRLVALRGRALVVLATLLFSAACSQRPAWPPAPADPELGNDACAHCRMIVSDARYAAQYCQPDGTVEFFDDLGCLLATHGGAGCVAQGTFVRSFDDARWIRGDEGFVVRAAAFSSPMGFGLAAFAARPEAETEARAREGANIHELDTLLHQDRSAAGSPAAGLPDGIRGDRP